MVFLLGESLEELGGSEYLKVAHGMVAGQPPALDLDLERDVQEAIREAIGARIVKSAHDCSEGGIAVTLAECCIAGRIGADIHLHDGLHPTASLFGETQSRIVATVADADAEELVTILLDHEVPYSVIGTVGGDALSICERLSVPVAELAGAFEPTLERLVHGEVVSEELREG